MDLDGAVNAKAEVFAQAFGFAETAAAAPAGPSVPRFAPERGSHSHRAIVAGRRRRRRDARDLIALGVLAPSGHNGDPGDLKLGLFIQRNDLRDHPIVDAAQRLTRGEMRVIYTGRAVRRAADLPLNAGPCRPLRIGGSIGHPSVTAGTIGCFCRHEEGGIGILSNNHVLARTNRAARGDIVLQPGRADGGRRNDPNSRVAALYRSVDIAFEPEARNLVDCAFATLLGGVGYDGGTVADPLALAPAWSVGPPADGLLIGDAVRKVGRTTGHTRGRVAAIGIDNLVVAMVLGHGERLARFDGQFSVEGVDGPFSRGGDSGSVVFTQDGKATGLLFAGTERGGAGNHGLTYANPIRTVLAALELEIHTGGDGGAA